jgi:glycerophosphoryl diester phosphodiesterase
VNQFYRNQPLNIAHRGASFDVPENTLAAFDLALRYGADGIELDVQLSADGVPVVIHDEALDRTTDGHGPVSAWRWTELRGLDAGSWFDRQFARQRIPSLEDVFATFGQRLLYHIELKTSSIRDQGLEKAVIAIIERHNLGDQTLLASFNPWALRRARRLQPQIALGLLVSPNQPFYMRWTRFGGLLRYAARHPKHTLVDASYLDWAARYGYRVSVWTVDEPDEMTRLAALGVDAIISNRPDVLKWALSPGGRERSRERGTQGNS